MTFCLLFYTSNPFQKGSTLKRKNLLPRQLKGKDCSLGEQILSFINKPFPKRGQILYIIISLKVSQFHLNNR